MRFLRASRAVPRLYEVKRQTALSMETERFLYSERRGLQFTGLLALMQILHDFRIHLVQTVQQQDNNCDDPDTKNTVLINIDNHRFCTVRLYSAAGCGADKTADAQQESDNCCGDTTADFETEGTAAEDQAFLTNMEFPLTVLYDVTHHTEDNSGNRRLTNGANDGDIIQAKLC